MKEIEIFVPGRLCLIGEISDLVGPYLSKNKSLIPGCAIAVALKKGIYLKAKKSNIFKYENGEYAFECEITENRLKQEAEGSTFYSYMCGTILYLKKNYKISGIDIEIEKMDLPMKKGLSSSAAICIAVAKSYNMLYNLNLTDNDIKKIAYEGELLAQSKCGKLDQESIMNDKISYITFNENEVVSKPITVKENVYVTMVDLNSEKDTRAIMRAVNNALPFAKNEKDNAIHQIIGIENKKRVQTVANALKEGDIKKIGETFSETQQVMDKAIIACEEFKAPVLHKVLGDENIKQLTYGGKSVGSGGDGTALLVCKDERSQQELSEYIQNELKMDTISLYIEKT